MSDTIFLRCLSTLQLDFVRFWFCSTPFALHSAIQFPSLNLFLSYSPWAGPRWLYWQPVPWLLLTSHPPVLTFYPVPALSVHSSMQSLLLLILLSKFVSVPQIPNISTEPPFHGREGHYFQNDKQFFKILLWHLIRLHLCASDIYSPSSSSKCIVRKIISAQVQKALARSPG